MKTFNSEKKNETHTTLMKRTEEDEKKEEKKKKKTDTNGYTPTFNTLKKTSVKQETPAVLAE